MMRSRSSLPLLTVTTNGSESLNLTASSQKAIYLLLTTGAAHPLR